MIEIKGLTKIFKSKKGEKVKALDNVSFTLPNSGFVFIVGKSGSGKTTLLNMIAAVDNYSSGEIVFNGINLNKLKSKELDYYRNENIGFIFQDYQLLDNLTVFQNVKLALDFLNETNEIKVHEAIKSVGLEELENRYPRELSGGEKQRVAIARAIVKNPSVILADEPTGNLDMVNSKEILGILREISKDRLVLIVTHNIFDAHEYASYILELSYGKLIGTYQSNDTNNKSIEVRDGILRLPLHKDIIESEKKSIIEDLNNDIIDITQDDKDFVPCELVNSNKQNEKRLEKHHISFINAFKLGVSFLKNSFKTIILYSFIIASLFGIIYSSEVIISTDILESLNQTRINCDRELINLSDRSNPSYTPSVGQDVNFVSNEDINKLKAEGYKGKIYPTYSLFNSVLLDTIETYNPKGIKVIDDNYLSSYVDKLEFKFKNDEYKKEGLYVTDFIIDLFNLKNPNIKMNYHDKDKIAKCYNIFHLNGVIDTHYKEKYPDIYENIKYNLSNYKSENLFVGIDSKKMDDFIYDWYFYTNMYSFEPDFIDYLFDSNFDMFYAYENLEYKYKDKKIENGFNNFAYGNNDFNAISLSVYEGLTGNKLDLYRHHFHKLDEPITISVSPKKSNLVDDNLIRREITFTHTYKDGFYGYSGMILDVSNKELCKDLLPIRDITLENNDSLKKIFKEDKLKNLTLANYSIYNFRTHQRLTSIFNKIFKVVIALLILSSVIALVFYSTYIVKKNVRNIGILKSLGGRSNDILISFLLNIFITALVASILSIGFSHLFLFIIEKILLMSYHSASILFSNACNVVYLLNNYKLMVFNVFVISSLLICSLLLIFIKLNKYRPNELIKGGK